MAVRGERSVVYCRVGELVVYLCGSGEDQDVVLAEVLNSVVAVIKVRHSQTYYPSSFTMFNSVRVQRLWVD